MNSKSKRWMRMLCLMLGTLILGSPRALLADNTSDTLTVTKNGNVLAGSGSRNEGLENELTVSVPKADVPANAGQVSIKFMNSDGSESDALQFCKLADGSGFISLKSDPLFAVLPCATFTNMNEPIGAKDVTALLFPNGAPAGYKVMVTSDANNGPILPEPSTLLLFGSGLVGLMAALLMAAPRGMPRRVLEY